MQVPTRHRALVHLDHWWHSVSERQALRVLELALAERHMGLTGRADEADAHAVLMTAQGIWDGVRGHGPRPVDLARCAPYDAEYRIFPPFKAVESPSRLSLLGIPLGAFRNNCLWSSKGLVSRLGWQASNLESWLLWLDRAAELVPHPLGLGCEDWQAALLFETVVLSLHGPDFHRQAFGMGLSAALGSSRMLEALRMMDRLRHHVSREGMRRPWHATAADLQAGRTGAVVMGEWVHREFASSSGRTGQGAYDKVLKSPVPGTTDSYLYSVDYIVAVERPGRAVNGAVLSELARVLLNPSVQCEFGRVKGALPAVRDAVEETIDPEGWKLFHLASLCPDMLLPSMSQLQGSPKALRDRVAGAVRGLLQGSSNVEQAARCIARGDAEPWKRRWAA
jgi:hypothetical protein